MTGTSTIHNQQGAAAAGGDQKSSGWHFPFAQSLTLNNLKGVIYLFIYK